MSGSIAQTLPMRFVVGSSWSMRRRQIVSAKVASITGIHDANTTEEIKVAGFERIYSEQPNAETRCTSKRKIDQKTLIPTTYGTDVKTWLRLVASRSRPGYERHLEAMFPNPYLHHSTKVSPIHGLQTASRMIGSQERGAVEGTASADESPRVPCCRRTAGSRRINYLLSLRST